MIVVKIQAMIHIQFIEIDITVFQIPLYVLNWPHKARVNLKLCGNIQSILFIKIRISI